MSEFNFEALSETSTLTNPLSFAESSSQASGEQQSRAATPQASQSSTPASKKRGHEFNSSFAWKFARPALPGDAYLKNDAGDEVWRCSICPLPVAIRRKIKRTSGTAGALRHLDKHGERPEATTEMKRLKSTEISIQRLLNKQGDRAASILANSESTRGRVDIGILEKLIVRWIAVDSLPHSIVQSSGFRTLLRYCNPEADNLLPNSRTTVGAWVRRTLEEEKLEIKLQLQAALSSIHFTIDTWTSPNHLGLLGLVAHYTSDDGKLKHALIALQEIQGQHSGQNLARMILDIIDEYQIRNKIGYFMMDNVTSNDTFLHCLSQELQDTDNIKYDAELHRLRCNGHIINLAVQAFLRGINK